MAMFGGFPGVCTAGNRTGLGWWMWSPTNGCLKFSDVNKSIHGPKKGSNKPKKRQTNYAMLGCFLVLLRFYSGFIGFKLFPKG